LNASITEIPKRVCEPWQPSQYSDWAMGWKTGVQLLAWPSICLFAIVSRLVVGPTQPSTKRVPAALSLEVKWLEHEDDHSTPSSVKVKTVWNCTSIIPLHLHGVVLS